MSRFKKISKEETYLEQICPCFGVSIRGFFVVDRPVAGILHGGPAESLSIVFGQTPLGLGVGQFYDPQTGVPEH